MPASVASVVAIGDSITEGLNASVEANRWTNIVTTDLGATLLNQGLSGTVLQNSNDSGGSPRANNGRNRYITAMLGANLKEMAIVAYGLNDARYIAAPATMNVANYTIDLREVVLGLIGGGYARNRVVIVTPYWMSDFGFTQGTAGFTGQTRAGYEEYVQAARDLAAELGVYLADSYAAMRDGGGESLLDTDGIHPLDTGHAIIAATVLAARRSSVAEVDYSAYLSFDTFTDSDEPVTNHSGEKNSYWAQITGLAPATAGRVANGRYAGRAAGSGYRNGIIAPGANVEVEATLNCVTALADDNTGIGCRIAAAAYTLYWTRYSRTAGNIGLFKIVAGVGPTSLGTSALATFTAGTQHNLKLRAVGTSIKVLLNDVEIISATDSAIAGAGHVGILSGTVATGTTGVQLDGFSARAL